MPPRRQVPKSLRNCAEVIELGDDAISYCLVRRDPPPPETINTAHFPHRSKTVLLPARVGILALSRPPSAPPRRAPSLYIPRHTRGAFAFACERRDGSRHRADTAGPRRSSRRCTPPRRWWNRLDLARSARNFHPPHTTRSFQPARDARSPSLIPCTQSCKRSRLKKFFSPGRACCSDCLRVRRPPRLPPDPVCPIPPRRLPTGPEKRKKDAPNPQNRRRDESLTSPLTPKRSLTAPTRATEREADHGQAPEESPRARRGDGDDG